MLCIARRTGYFKKWYQGNEQQQVKVHLYPLKKHLFISYFSQIVEHESSDHVTIFWNAICK